MLEFTLGRIGIILLVLFLTFITARHAPYFLAGFILPVLYLLSWLLIRKTVPLPAVLLRCGFPYSDVNV